MPDLMTRNGFLWLKPSSLWQPPKRQLTMPRTKNIGFWVKAQPLSSSPGVIATSRGGYALKHPAPSTDFVSMETSVLALDHLLHDLTLIAYPLSASVFPPSEWGSNFKMCQASNACLMSPVCWVFRGLVFCLSGAP